MVKKAWLTLQVLVLLLTSCKVGPNYHPPYVDVPEEYHFEEANAVDSLDLEWWKQFEDPILEGLIIEALANNQEIKVAAANVGIAIGLLIQTRAPLFPQLGYNSSVSRMRTSETLTPAIPLPIALPNPQTVWQAVGTASWQIDLWGRIRRLVEAAEANVKATYEARQNAILAVVTSVADSYIQLRGLDEQLEIAIRTMNSYGDAVKYFELQHKYGQVSQIEVAQAKTQYEIAASQIPQIKISIVQTENALCVLLGRNPGPIARGKSIYDLHMPDVPAGLPSELLRQRPDIMQAEQNLIAANANIGAAIALYFPSVSLTGYYGGASAHLSQLFSGPSNTWNFVGSVTGPIFTAGAIYGQVMQAEEAEQATLFNYQLTIQKAFADVEDSLVAHSMLKEELASQERLVEAAGDYQRLAMLQYKGGYAPYFVVIQAQEQYFPAELSLAQTRASLFTSLVNIYRAMGGGWVELADARTNSCFPQDLEEKAPLSFP